MFTRINIKAFLSFNLSSNFSKIDVNLKTANLNFYSVKIVSDEVSNLNLFEFDDNLKMSNYVHHVYEILEKLVTFMN